MEDRAIFGVCGGLAQRFEKDALVLRLIFVLLALVFGLGIVLYLILAIFMKKPPKEDVIFLEGPVEECTDNISEKQEALFEETDNQSLREEKPEAESQSFTEEKPEAENPSFSANEEKTEASNQSFSAKPEEKTETSNQSFKNREEKTVNRHGGSKFGKLFGLVLIYSGMATVCKVFFPFFDIRILYGLGSIIAGIFFYIWSR